MTDSRFLRVERDGQIVVEAVVQPPDETGEARAEVSVASGHLPTGVRQEMADDVHQTVVEDEAQRLRAAVPRGDVELVEGLRDHLDHADLRAAGSTSIIEGDVRD